MTTAAMRTITPPSDFSLAGEHALLMRGVRRRADSVVALLDAHAWPHAELRTLVAFLRTAVLRQVSDEEVLLFPHDATAPPFAELCAEHVRLHTLTAQLERVLAQPCPPQELRALVTDLLATLHRHLLGERAVFEALPDSPGDVPSAAAVAAGDRAWRVADDGPVRIELDALPAEQATQLCLERVLRLDPGRSAEIHSGDARRVSEVCRWLHTFDSAGYGLVHVDVGHEHMLQVTRRRTG